MARHTGPASGFLASLEPGSVACIITDPPWDLAGGGRFNAVASYARQAVAEIVETLAAARAAVVPGGFLYTFAPTGPELAEVHQGMAETGWRFQRELAWKKGNSGLGAWQNCHEPILVYTNGPSRGYEMTGRFRSVLEYDRPAGRTAKPWQVYRAILEMSTRPGELVIDPWCGSNPLESACATLQPTRRWAANDVLSPEQVRVDLAKASLRKAMARQESLGGLVARRRPA